MTKKTNLELNDGEAVRTSDAVVAFDQADQTETLTTSIRPNPPNATYVRNETQLLAKFTNLEIPDGDKVTIVIDESFTLTQGFKIGTNSVLEIFGSTAEIELDTSGIGEPFLANSNPANNVRAVLIRDIFIKGDNTQPFCELKGASRIFIENCRVEGFDGAETEFPFTKLDNFSPVDWNSGWVLKNTSIIQIALSNLRQTSPKAITFLSIITNVVTSAVISNNSRSTLFAGDALLFIDPNAPVGLDVNIVGTSISAGDFYQLGTPDTVTAVADNGGKLRCTSTAHTQVDQTYAVLSGFSESTYNKTAKITVIDANTFDTDIDFVSGPDSGSVDRTSLDSTDVQVDAIRNPGQADSMSLAEARNGNNIDVVTSIGVFVPFENAVTVAGDFIQDDATESFVVDTSTGIITYIGLEPITVTLAYHYNIEKTGGPGGAGNATVSLFISNIQQAKTDQAITVSTTIQKITGAGGIFKIQPNNTFQLKIDNDSAHTDTVTEYIMLITRQ